MTQLRRTAPARENGLRELPEFPFFSYTNAPGFRRAVKKKPDKGGEDQQWQRKNGERSEDKNSLEKHEPKNKGEQGKKSKAAAGPVLASKSEDKLPYLGGLSVRKLARFLEYLTR